MRGDPSRLSQIGGQGQAVRTEIGSRLRWWLPLALAISIGVTLGLGGFTLMYGEGLAYLSDEPKACANCHVMDEAFNSWVKSSHHHVATCNDCHLPPSTLGKILTKADNGFFHSLAFTTGDYPTPIRIKPRNRRVTGAACLKCHQDLFHDTTPTLEGSTSPMCVHCHTDPGHGLR